MPEKRIEMHCHTLFSVDATGTPESLAEAAAGRGVEILSVTEHNSVESCHRAAARAGELGIRYLPGVEIDAFFRGTSYHFLAFGFDPTDPLLLRLLERQRRNYVVRFHALFEELRALGFPADLEDIQASLFEAHPTYPDQVLNPWFLTRYIRRHPESERWNIALQQATEAVRKIPFPDDSSAAADGRFCAFEEARDVILGTGGVLLLAHVGKALHGRPEAQTQLIRDLMEEGLDGFELYHPFNRDEHPVNRGGPQIFKALQSLAGELNAVLSGGSDCHHAPGEGTTELGSCGAPMEILSRMNEVLRDRSQK